MPKITCRIILLGLLLSLPATGALLAQGAVNVLTDQVAELEFQDQITLVGRTEPWIAGKIVSEVAGQVAGIAAEEGTWVQAGEQLIELDAQRLRFTWQSQQAVAEQAKLTWELAQQDLARTEELHRQELISDTRLDSARTWVRITEERYLQAAAERDRLALDLDNAVIRAPYSGYTGRRMVDVGEWVERGTAVFELVDLSHVRVRADLPERHFGRLSIGSEVTIVMTANGGEVLTGMVAGITPNASSETHTFPVIIDVPNEGGRLGGGMLVRATLSLDDSFTSLAVSKDAIIRQGER
ncbi:MAG: efflux RND transporter periplasmic adaptor subunit, partial [bacterium]